MPVNKTLENLITISEELTNKEIGEFSTSYQSFNLQQLGIYSAKCLQIDI
jgi:hypothetical protein